MIKYFLSFIFCSHFALAGLPPTTSKLSSDANNVTTFNFQFPNFTGTHTGTTLSLGVNNIAGGGTNNGSLGVTAGGVVYTDGSKLVNTGAGTTGQALVSNGASAPTWVNVLTNPMTTGGDIIYGGSGGTPTRLANGTAGQYLVSTGGTTAPSWTTPTLPTIQRFTSGSGTYTTPAGVKYIIVEFVGPGGGGGGGGGSGGSPGNGSPGSAPTTFGTSLLTANAGGGGNGGSLTTPGAGGTTTINSPAVTILNVRGGSGQAGSSGVVNTYGLGGEGGSTPYGSSKGGGVGQNAATTQPNTGVGGGGGSTPAGVAGGYAGGCGGGGGGYGKALINSPGASYSYVIGTGGAGGAGGTGAGSGAPGSDGAIVVIEYYQ